MGTMFVTFVEILNIFLSCEIFSKDILNNISKTRTFFEIPKQFLKKQTFKKLLNKFENASIWENLKSRKKLKMKKKLNKIRPEHPLPFPFLFLFHF